MAGNEMIERGANTVRINIRPIAPADDAAMAKIVRDNLKSHHLDVPGTAYYDPELEHLSRFYSGGINTRAYFVAAAEDGRAVGGIGMDVFPGFESCGEIQKLYISDEIKRQGVGQRLLDCIEAYARNNGIQRLYLETHSALKAAVCLYEKNGYHRIDKPKEVVHNTMDLFYIKELTP